MVYLYPFLDRLFPNICLLCAQDTCDISVFCRACTVDLPYIESACPRCSRPANTQNICPECQLAGPGLDAALAVFHYTYPVTTLLKQAKYNARLKIINALGEIMVRKLLSSGNTDVDCLIPVPLHYRRQSLRGYNQSSQLARLLGKHLNIAVDNHLVKRQINTAPQFGLGTKNRIKNLQNAFLAKGRSKYQSVAIIDDIITTGSTVYELTRVLRDCGVDHVSAWVLAHAGKEI